LIRRIPGPAGFSGSLIVAEFASHEAATESGLMPTHTLRPASTQKVIVKPFKKVLPA
jgi:hypothetical protein